MELDKQSETFVWKSLRCMCQLSREECFRKQFRIKIRMFLQLLIDLLVTRRLLWLSSFPFYLFFVA